MADVDLEGCGDHSCVVAKPGGMGTNGGCRCERVHLRRAVHVLRERLRAVEAERDEVQVRESDARRDHVSAMKRADAAEARVRDLEALLVAVIEEGEAIHIHTGKKRGLGEYARRESAVWDEARRLFALRAALKGGTDG